LGVAYAAGSSVGQPVLTRLEPDHESRPAKVQIEKHGQYSVGVLDHPIIERAINEALREFRSPPTALPIHRNTVLRPLSSGFSMSACQLMLPAVLRAAEEVVYQDFEPGQQP